MSQAQTSKYHRNQVREEKQRLAGMSTAQRAQEQEWFNVPHGDANSDVEMEPVDLYADEVRAGTAQMDIGAGGEESLGRVGEDVREFYENFGQARRNRSKRVVDAFGAQMEAIGDAFEEYELFVDKHGADVQYEHPPDSTVLGTSRIFVVDLLSAQYREIHEIEGDLFVASRLVRQGLFPCAPYSPSVAFTTRTIQVFHQLHLRCPRLGKQAFVRALCDLQTTPPRTNLETQFTIALDLYLRTKELVRQRVAVDLGRDDPDWRLKNACPCCFYKVKGEQVLNPPFFVTQDGNNSLKRVENLEKLVRSDGTVGRLLPSREEVNKFGKEELAELLKTILRDPDFDDDEDGCQERWNNMKEEITARAWSLYAETGIFIAVCRHSFCLVICDMIGTGSQPQPIFSASWAGISSATT
ncbi:hypothetical protein MKEN_00194000 [Mycena kentingensis (nom. inval.)]|nr:hypothetical protein MKEN_00194000 [Mycena kentingensis (nom. inval.)]